MRPWWRWWCTSTRTMTLEPGRIYSETPCVRHRWHRGLHRDAAGVEFWPKYLLRPGEGQ